MRSSSRKKKALLRFGPYVVTALVVVAILRRYPIDDIVRAVGAGRAAAVFPVAFAFSIAQIVFASAWDAVALRAVLGRVRYLDVIRVKAGCAVLQSIGFVLNAGAYGTWIARATRTGPSASAGLVLYFTLSDLAAGSLFATVASLVMRVDVGPVLRYGAPIVFVAVAALLLLPSRVEIDRERPALTDVFRAVPRPLAVLQLLGRTISAALLVTAIWAAANAFGLPIPFSGALAYVPLVILVGALPVNVLGFGPVQGVWLLFTHWAPGASVLAFQMVWNVAILVAYLVRGAVFVPRILREVAEGRAGRDSLASRTSIEVRSSLE